MADDSHPVVVDAGSGYFKVIFTSKTKLLFKIRL
jgi:hypothetical protein